MKNLVLKTEDEETVLKEIFHEYLEDHGCCNNIPKLRVVARFLDRLDEIAEETPKKFFRK